MEPEEPPHSPHSQDMHSPQRDPAPEPPPPPPTPVSEAKQPQEHMPEEKPLEAIVEEEAAAPEEEKEPGKQVQLLATPQAKPHSERVSPQGALDKSSEEKAMAKRPSKVLMGCSCQKSKCSKNYCECYTQGKRCTEVCKCKDCENTAESEGRPNVKPDEPEDKICYCKKTNCLKKYCECFNNGLRCNSNCKCEECKNTDDLMEPQEEEKEERKERSEAEIREINAKIDEIARLTPPEYKDSLLAFLEYCLN